MFTHMDSRGQFLQKPNRLDSLTIMAELENKSQAEHITYTKTLVEKLFQEQPNSFDHLKGCVWHMMSSTALLKEHKDQKQDIIVDIFIKHFDRLFAVSETALEKGTLFKKILDFIKTGKLSVGYEINTSALTLYHVPVRTSIFSNLYREQLLNALESFVPETYREEYDQIMRDFAAAKQKAQYCSNEEDEETANLRTKLKEKDRELEEKDRRILELEKQLRELIQESNATRDSNNRNNSEATPGMSLS